MFVLWGKFTNYTYLLEIFCSQQFNLKRHIDLILIILGVMPTIMYSAYMYM